MSVRSGNSARFSSALSSKPNWPAAVEEAAEEICARLGGQPNWAALFVSASWKDDLAEIAASLANGLGTEHVVGCTAESLVGRGQELEWMPGLSVLAAQLPSLPLSFHVRYLQTPDGGTFVGWPDAWIDAGPRAGTIFLLADPFSFPADYFLERLGEDHPRLRAVGGMASGATTPGECRFVLQQRLWEEGAVITYFDDSQPLWHIVSQGCRPIGRPLVVTRADRNLLYELGGRPALLQLQTIFDELPNHEKELLRNGLHIGRVVNEYQERFEPGDFLIRNVLGIERDSGALVVADYLRVGQTVQFHVRDHRSADVELRQLLRQHCQPAPAAALLFTCNGRGTRLFPTAHHDALTIQEILGDIPLAGFFAQGEIGPVGKANFVHGFTASLLLFG